MDSDGSYFTREFELDSTEVVTLYQKCEGDVSCVVWDAALVLAKYIEVNNKRSKNKNWIQGKKVMELGAGLGCVGLTAACYGGIVNMTDLPEAIDLLQKNINKNKDLFTLKGGSASCQSLEWGSKNIYELEKPEILLLADCVYYNESIQPLVDTICQLSDETTEILLCQEERISDIQIQVWTNFQDLLAQHFEVKRIPASEQHERFSSSDICIMKLSKK